MIRLKSLLSAFVSLVTLATLLMSSASSAQFFSTKADTVILPPNTKVSELSDTVIFNGSKALNGSDIIKTGFTAFSDGKYQQIAVLGDINADGKVNSTDYTQLRRCYLELFDLSDLCATAADINLDGKLSSTDYIRIRNVYLERYDFSLEKPFSSNVTASGSIIPDDIYAPSSEEICLTSLNNGKYVNYYFTADFSGSAYGYFDIALVSPHDVDSLTLIISKDDNENKFIISDVLSEPFRFNYCYGDGDYHIKASIKSGDKSFTALNFTVTVNLKDEFAPFLISAYPTIYDDSTEFVKKATELCSGLDSDLEKIAACYRYIVDTQDYLYTVSTDEYKYLPDLDDIYSREYGVCWDFCAALAAMLRSQGIPCKINIGFAYDITNFGHAWVEAYTDGQESYEDSYLKMTDGWCLLDITASVTKSDPTVAKDYIESMSETYSAFKYF